MKEIKLVHLFDNDLLKVLNKFMRIPIKEVRDSLLMGFVQHEQVLPILEKHDINPILFYCLIKNNC